MIKQKCFEKLWLENLRNATFKGMDPLLLEKVLYAFELLGMLSVESSNFVFRGGSSLLLLLPDLNRLSIDIDIVLPINGFDFQKMIYKSKFTRFEHSNRLVSKIPKTHYKFYYNSIINQKEQYILLDIFESEIQYNKLIPKIIKNNLFETESEVFVKIPSTEDLFADKLTAFAPNTIGIPFGKNKSMEIGAVQKAPLKSFICVKYDKLAYFKN